MTISAIAYDATTGKKIENAVVKLEIIFTSNDTSKEMIGHNGEVTYSAELKPNSKGTLLLKLSWKRYIRVLN